jgi:hypothetical protein
MPIRSDFRVLAVNAHFGEDESDIDTVLPFFGNFRSVNFNIDGNPLDGYLLLNTFDVDSDQHRIQINERHLPSSDLIRKAADNRWQVRMDAIPDGVLLPGNNTLTIRRAEGSDSFLVAEVTVHWREEG